jgi:hypothetical protein
VNLTEPESTLAGSEGYWAPIEVIENGQEKTTSGILSGLLGWRRRKLAKNE